MKEEVEDAVHMHVIMLSGWDARMHGTILYPPRKVKLKDVLPPLVFQKTRRGAITSTFVWI